MKLSVLFKSYVILAENLFFSEFSNEQKKLKNLTSYGSRIFQQYFCPNIPMLLVCVASTCNLLDTKKKTPFIFDRKSKLELDNASIHTMLVAITKLYNAILLVNKEITE